MAKQDLYKTAQQSAKLFKLLKENQQLEGWVSAKISKAAEDISTVYQYLNYEKQFQDYSKMIAESTNLSDSKRSLLESKLAEAKEKVKELKKKAAKDKSEKMDEEKEMKVGDTKKTRTGELTKTSTGVVHKNTSYKDDGDEIASNAKSGKGIKSHAKAETAAEKKEKAPAQKMSPKSAKTWGMSNSEKFDNRDKVDEAKDEKCNHSAKGKKCPVHGLKECGMYEAATKTMSRAAKGYEKYGKAGMTALAKAGREGKDLDKVRDKYDKYNESTESDHKKPCPPMSHVKKMCNDGKSVSEICKMHPDCDHAELKQMVADCKKNMDEGKMPMKKVGGKSVPAFAADGKGKNDLEKKKESDKIKEAIARAKVTLEGKGKKKDKMDMEGNAFGLAVVNAKKDGVQPGEKVKVGGKSIPLRESVELDRMKVLMTRLNG